MQHYDLRFDLAFPESGCNMAYSHRWCEQGHARGVFYYIMLQHWQRCHGKDG
jgi:hypothetical protein